MNIAPVPIKPACLRIIGIATLPTADAPVKNLAASIQLRWTKTNAAKWVWELDNKDHLDSWLSTTHPPPSRLIRNCVEPPPKKRQGIGTRTYIRAGKPSLMKFRNIAKWPTILKPKLNINRDENDDRIQTPAGEKTNLPISLSVSIFHFLLKGCVNFEWSALIKNLRLTTCQRWKTLIIRVLYYGTKFLINRFNRSKWIN